MEEQKIDIDEVIACEKCGKKKKMSEGNFVLEGSTFCCKTCCGEPGDDKHQEKASAVCEFC